MTYHFRLFFYEHYDGTKYISFQDIHDPGGGGNFSKFSIIFYGTYEIELLIIDITMACDISI